MVVTPDGSKAKLEMIVPILRDVKGKSPSIVFCKDWKTGEDIAWHLRENRIRCSVLYPYGDSHKVLWNFKVMPRYVMIVPENQFPIMMSTMGFRAGTVIC